MNIRLQRLGAISCLLLAFCGTLSTQGKPATTLPIVTQSSQTTALAQAAAQLLPGHWVRFSAAENSSWNGGSLLNLGPKYVGTDNAMQWSSKASWNPVTRELYYTGGGHGSAGTDAPDAALVLRYRDETNAWSANYRSGTHTYEGATINSTAGPLNNLYLRPYSSNEIEIYSISDQAWTPSTVPRVPADSHDCCLAMEYFPERNSLITIDNDEGIYEYSFASKRWSGCLVNTLVEHHCGASRTAKLCLSHTTAAPWTRYDPVNHRLLFGGCTAVWALSPELKLAPLASSLFNISAAPSGSPITIDPATGNLISWDKTGSTFVSDGATWVEAGPSPFPDPINRGLACAPVTTYQLILCIYAETGSVPVTGASLWLYRAGRVSSLPANPAVSPVPKTSAADAPALFPDSSGKANSWAARVAGVNVPGGRSSVLDTQSFDTFPQTNQQQYFRMYDSESITTDCSIAADGCSLKFSIRKGYRQGEPGWFDWNFSPDLSRTFGEGQEFYVQYRERVDAAMLQGRNFPDSEGFKSHIITDGDIPSHQAHDCTNSPSHLVMQQNGRGAVSPFFYTNCGYSGGPYAFMREVYEQISLPGIKSGSDNNYLDQNAAGCPHYSGRGTPVGDPTCWNYVAGEWFTVQVHVKVGAFNQPTSIIEAWLAHEGQPSRLLMNAVDAALVNDGSSSASGKYGKISLLPYQTAMSGSLVDTAVWYDDLIAATRRVPDPDVATPNPPDSFTLSKVTSTSVTLNWRVNSQNGTAQDDNGFLVERCNGSGQDCFPNPQAGFHQIGATSPGAHSYMDQSIEKGKTYTYRVRARNSAGNSAYTIGQCFNSATSCGGTVTIP